MNKTTNELRQLLKEKRRWPNWLRSAFLLKWLFRLALFTWRLYRLWHRLTGDTDS